MSSTMIEKSKMLEFQKEALNITAIVAETNEKGRIIYSNDNFCKISGYSKEELFGSDHRILNSGYHPREFFQDLWETIQSGKVWQGEIKNKAKNGSYYWVDTTIVPFKDEMGGIKKFIAIRRDITQKKSS